MDSEAYAEQYLELLIGSRKQLLESLVQKPVSGEEFVVEYLSGHPEPVYPSELSERMQASSARIAAILRQLEKLSVILRHEDGFDARRHPVLLSEEGKRLAAEIHSRRLRSISHVFEAIGEEETKEYIRITEHLIRVIKEQEAKSETEHHPQKRPAHIF